MIDKNSIYITMDEYLGTSGPIANLSPELQGNANTLIPKINELLSSFGEKRNVTSGLRSMEHHLEIYRIKNEQRHANGLASVKVPLSSAHLSAQAVDLEDKDRCLTNWCLLNLVILERCGLWMEDPSSATTWVHLQCRPTKNRVFIP